MVNKVVYKEPPKICSEWRQNHTY